MLWRSKMSNLTSKEFWDSYWNEIDLPCTVDVTRPFERCLIRKLDLLLERYLSGRKDASIFEVGCAPGKWLAYLSLKHSLNPCGVEYLDKAYDATVRNLKSLNLSSNGIINGDFFKIESRPMHDIVISLGFIDAGFAELEVKKYEKNNSCFHVIGTGYSNSTVDYFFKIRDRYESIIDSSSLCPIKFMRSVEEGNASFKQNYIFNQTEKTVFDGKSKISTCENIQDMGI